MTKREYKLRCGQLRAAIKANDYDNGIFRVATIRGMRYVYNTVSRNVIYKERVRGNTIGIQYRATSIYRPVMERARGNSPFPVLRVASPNMRRHVRDVRARIAS